MTLTEQSTIQSVIPVAGVIATFAAVVVALFGDWLRGRLFRPKLVLSLKDISGTYTPIEATKPGGETLKRMSRWYHVVVSNQRRLSPATDVQVLLLRVEEPDGLNQFAVKWNGELPLPWRQGSLYPMLRSVTYPIEADLFYVLENEYMELCTVIQAFALQNRKKPPVKLRLTLQAKSSEVDSNLLHVTLGWNGNWVEDQIQMQSHLTIMAESSKEEDYR